MGKGSKQRLVPVGSYACEAIARYLKNGRPQLESKAKGPTERRALFLNKRGKRLSRQSVWEIIRAAGDVPEPQDWNSMFSRISCAIPSPRI